MSDEYVGSMNEDFAKVADGFKQQLATIRTGRASPQLVENVQVSVQSYGATMPLNQLSSITAPDARLLVVNPWDKSTLHDIEKALMGADLGLNPSSDGQIIRVPIPALTGERRQEMVKQVRKMVEDARIRGRSVRREYNELFRDLEDGKEITQDDLKRYLSSVQEGTDSLMKTIETIAGEKETEVLEV